MKQAGKTVLTLDVPGARQRDFLLERRKYVAFGGARGGGKSWAVRTKAALLCLRYPGIRVMIVRRSYPELRANHILPMKALLSGLAEYHETVKEFSFPNGSAVLFRFAATEKDLDKYQGTEVDVLFIDEATQFTEAQFERFTACVRGVNAFPKRIYLTCNPGGVGHGWLKRRFVDRNFRPGENPEDYVFIRSRVTDNLPLLKADPDYVRRLEALPPKLRRAWLDGDWNVFEGQFFEEFRDDPAHYDDRRFTHVIAPFAIPAGWNVVRSFDFGFAKPFSCDWWAIDYDGRAYLFLQLYGCTGTPNEGVRWHPDRIFSEIATLERTHPDLKGRRVTGVADPSIWDRSRGDAIVDFADRHGVWFDKGDNERIPGWMQVHARLAFDEDGLPMVYFFSTCKDALRTLPLQRFSDVHPEDLDTALEDHFPDSFRYFCMSRPITPRPVPSPVPLGDDPLDLRKR